MENFDFISDSKLKTILERDYKELIKCYESECYKSVLVLSGSLIEALIVEYFINKLPEGYTEKQILTLNLSELLTLAVSNSLIGQRIEALSTVVKNYRNLIHPGREIRFNEYFDKETANVSISLVKLILKEIKINYVKLYGYSAKDIIQKISNDTVSIGIFEELIKKLNYVEILRLFHVLIEFEVSENWNKVDNPKQYVNILKSYIKQEDLIAQLNILHYKVETGMQSEIITYLNLFKEDLNLLEDTKRELIIKYGISVLNSISARSEINKFIYPRTFITISNYIESSKYKEDYKTMLLEYYHGQEELSNIQYLYNQLILGLTKETRDAFETYFKVTELEFSRFYDDTDDNDIPF